MNGMGTTSPSTTSMGSSSVAAAPTWQARSPLVLPIGSFTWSQMLVLASVDALT